MDLGEPFGRNVMYSSPELTNQTLALEKASPILCVFSDYRI